MALSPEQIRAIDIFKANYCDVKPCDVTPINSLPLSRLITTNAQIFIKGKITRNSLPHERLWRWHQSKSKVQKKLDDCVIILAKLNPRKIKTNSLSDIQVPSYKLWVFEVISLFATNNGPLYFLWCEKGNLSSSCISNIQFTENRLPSNTKVLKEEETEELSLRVEELSFLADFVDPELANQLGWLPDPN